MIGATNITLYPANRDQAFARSYFIYRVIAGRRIENGMPGGKFDFDVALGCFDAEFAAFILLRPVEENTDRDIRTIACIGWSSTIHFR